MFGAEPSVVKHDYAKWMLEDPRVNFAISQRDAKRAGVNHLGFQVEKRLGARGDPRALEAARLEGRRGTRRLVLLRALDKYWDEGPAAIAWESFHTLGTVPVYGRRGRAGASGR
jgi:hypothetical protein